MSGWIRFRSTIAIRGINPYVRVGVRRAARLKRGWRKPLPVLVRVNGKPESPGRVNLMPIGNGGFYLYLSGQLRKASAAEVGDVVTIAVRFDGEYQAGPAHPMPRWFDEALRRHPDAKSGWKTLSPSRQKEILRYFSNLRSPEAKARNLRRAVQVLSGGKARFMARSWNDDRR